MFDDDLKTIEFTYGGLTFEVDAEIENEYVVGVQDVRVWTNDKKYVQANCVDSIEFLDTFNDQLQEAYQRYLEDLEIAAAEMRMDCEKEERALENWEKNN